ncbi:MAG TPA: BadF/BadG/BcrA/BcrD ATPase family protein [Herpetosiphonaceae bacterium]|nr:BadF/BadG/BcrA/BcrD ATPase family protein [Herpetosiphonaceae bacterium]
MPELLLGVDGGGSKTVALVADRSGTLLGRGEAASSNHQSVGFPAAVAAIDGATRIALEQAGYDAVAPISAACFGLAGAARPADRARFDTWLVEQARVGRWSIVIDAELVLAAGTPVGWGVALICGTGSICYGRSADGRTARAGGWGYLMGDEGSGYAVGVGALRLATQTADGRADADMILRATLDYWRLREASELIAHVYHPSRTRADIAALARPVAELADQGDPSAQELMAQAARELARLIDAVVHTLDLYEPPVALGGGLLGARPSLQRAVVAQAAVALGLCTYVAEPARGAVILARRILSNTNDPQPSGT